MDHIFYSYVFPLFRHSGPSLPPFLSPSLAPSIPWTRAPCSFTSFPCALVCAVYRLFFWRTSPRVLYIAWSSRLKSTSGMDSRVASFPSLALARVVRRLFSEKNTKPAGVYLRSGRKSTWMHEKIKNSKKINNKEAKTGKMLPFPFPRVLACVVIHPLARE